MNWNLIAWGALALLLASGGYYIKDKLDENTQMKNQITDLQQTAKALKDLQDKYNLLDGKLVALKAQKDASFAKTDKGAVNAYKTPSLTSNRLTPEQLCYWNDYGDADAVTACLRDAEVSGTPKAP